MSPNILSPIAAKYPHSFWALYRLSSLTFWQWYASFCPLYQYMWLLFIIQLMSNFLGSGLLNKIATYIYLVNISTTWIFEQAHTLHSQCIKKWYLKCSHFFSFHVLIIIVILINKLFYHGWWLLVAMIKTFINKERLKLIMLT